MSADVEDFQIEKATLNSTRTPNHGGDDIVALITDINIYENILSPVLTIDLMIMDTAGILNRFDFTGGAEYIDLIINSDHFPNNKPIEKRFRLLKISQSKKNNERTEIISFYGMEEHGFASVANNINRAYTGKPGAIIQQIASQYLNKVVDQSVDEYQSPIKAIVPNLTPMQSLKWFTLRMTTHDGLPFYIYSSLGFPNLILNDLGSMLNENVINPDKAYGFWQSMGNTPRDFVNKYFTIHDYKHENVDDILSMLQQGVVSSRYMFHDVTTARSANIEFDATDLYNMLLENSYLPLDQNNPNFGLGIDINGTDIENLQNSVYSIISSGRVYGSEYNSIDEEALVGGYFNRLLAKSAHAFANKTPITLRVNGSVYLAGDTNTTLGNKIDVRFFSSQMGTPDDKPILDLKKSGDYLIFGAKHSFRAAETKKHYVNMRCVKLSSYQRNTVEV